MPFTHVNAYPAYPILPPGFPARYFQARLKKADVLGEGGFHSDGGGWGQTDQPHKRHILGLCDSLGSDQNSWDMMDMKPRRELGRMMFVGGVH